MYLGDEKETLEKVIDDLHDRLHQHERALFFLLKKIGPLSEQDEVLFLDLLSGYSNRNIYFEDDGGD